MGLCCFCCHKIGRCIFFPFICIAIVYCLYKLFSVCLLHRPSLKKPALYLKWLRCWWWQWGDTSDWRSHPPPPIVVTEFAIARKTSGKISFSCRRRGLSVPFISLDRDDLPSSEDDRVVPVARLCLDRCAREGDGWGTRAGWRASAARGRERSGVVGDGMAGREGGEGEGPKRWMLCIMEDEVRCSTALVGSFAFSHKHDYLW